MQITLSKESFNPQFSRKGPKKKQQQKKNALLSEEDKHLCMFKSCVVAECVPIALASYSL